LSLARGSGSVLWYLRVREGAGAPVSVLEKLGNAGAAIRRRLSGMPLQSVQVEVSMQKLGSEYGGYWVCPEGLGAESVVYSFGIGEDVSFDLAFIARFGAEIHAFDPTPRSIAWARAQNLPSGFVLHEYGLADYDGVARFSPPENPEHVSHTVLRRDNASGPPVEVQVKRLETVMKELGHDHVDVLKMDVEGAEYGVVEELCRGGVRPKQILLEYHHHLEGVPLWKTERSIRRLNGAGYRIFHVSDTGRELSLILP
jgi:FkbM family methyltransferase